MIDTTRYLAREGQFCVLCYAAGNGWVRVINAADLLALRQGRTEDAARSAYRARRQRALRRHLRTVHPGVLA